MLRRIPEHPRRADDDGHGVVAHAVGVGQHLGGDERTLTVDDGCERFGCCLVGLHLVLDMESRRRRRRNVFHHLVVKIAA